jgi:hypothetical protein
MVTASNAGANSLARLRPKNPENEFNAENRFYSDVLLLLLLHAKEKEHEKQ